MMLQRYKIQLESYQAKKTTILKQMAPIKEELADIDDKIKNESISRNQVWRQIFKKNRLLGIPDPEPITDFKLEISKSNSQLENLSTSLSSNELEITSLQKQLLIHHANGQDIINNEIQIHAEEKERITAKLADINNEYITNLLLLLDIKSTIQLDNIAANIQLCNIECDISSCKKTEKRNRGIIIDVMRKVNDIRRIYRDKSVELNSEVAQLTSEADGLANLRNTIKIRLEHLVKFQSTENATDITPDIENLQYELDTINRRINRINNTINQIQKEIFNLQKQQEADIANIPAANDMMIPITTPYKELITIKNNITSQISQLQEKNISLDEQINGINSKYESMLQQIQEEDQRANDRLTIMITRCTSNYNKQDAEISNKITTLAEKSTNLKRQIFIKRKELENWDNAYKTECQYEYRKTQLISKLANLQQLLAQINKDIETITNITTMPS